MEASDLRQASFRGIEFACRDIGGARGRRVVINEYPGRDDITYDDRGRSKRPYRLAAVITGEDWNERYHALLDACELPGAGDLIHPDGWKRKVVLTEPADYSILSVGEVTVSMSFVEVSDTILPTAEPDKVTAVEGFASSLLGSSKDSFTDIFESSAEAVESITETISTVTDTINQLAPPDEIGQAIAAMQILEKTLTVLTQTPGDLADAWTAVFEAISDLDTATMLTSQLGTSAISSYAIYQAALISDMTPDFLEKKESIASFDYYLWTVSLGTLANSIAGIDWVVYDDAEIAVIDASDDFISAEGYTDDSTVVSDLTDLRGSLVDSVLIQAQLLPRLKTYTPDAVISSSEVAQLLYQDGSRGGEINERNGTQHPGFLPVEEILVLTE